MVVKNVSGFDLPRVYHGSLGTFGVIVSANFKVLPRPRGEATLLASFADAADAFLAANTLRESREPIAALEVFRSNGEVGSSRFASRAASRQSTPCGTDRETLAATPRTSTVKKAPRGGQTMSRDRRCQLRLADAGPLRGAAEGHWQSWPQASSRLDRDRCRCSVSGGVSWTGQRHLRLDFGETVPPSVSARLRRFSSLLLRQPHPFRPI